MIEQQQIEEAIIKKGAVAAYALQGRKHGNNAVKSYNRAKQTLRALANATSTNQKVDALVGLSFLISVSARVFQFLKDVGKCTGIG